MYPAAVISQYHLLDDVYGNYVSFQRGISAEIRKLPKERGGLRVLEIGSGTGITSKLILASRPDIDLLSIDFDSRMVTICSEAIRKRKNAKVILADALEYLEKNEANSFDAIVSAFTIHNFKISYRKMIYKHAYRVLKQGGVFVNADKVIADGKASQIEALNRRLGTYIRVFSKAQQFEALEYWIGEYLRDFRPDYAMVKSKEIALLRSKGFSEAKFINYYPSKMMAMFRAQK